MRLSAVTLAKSVIACLATVIALSYWIVINPNKLFLKKPAEQILTGRNNFKKILYWNNMWYAPDWNFGYGSKPFIRYGCSETRCLTMKRIASTKTDSDLELLSSADAILFHVPTFEADNINFPLIRYARQLWIFASKEPPTRVDLHLNLFPPHAFNLTMTYLRDSDVYWGYGHVEVTMPNGTAFSSRNGIKFPHINEVVPSPVAADPKLNKTKVLAWFVSNCQSWSGRELYYRELVKYIPIDVYGECFQTNEIPHKSCHKHSNDGTPNATYSMELEILSRNACYRMLESTYHFYLALENSLCDDYVSEKFFETLPLDIVPIVFGGSNYRTFAPPGTYIDVGDYATPKELARYLMKLMSDPNLYAQFIGLKMRAIKEKSMVVSPTYPFYVTAKAMCDLCDLLHSPSLNRRKKNYSNIIDWWYYHKGRGTCKKYCLPWGTCYNTEYEPYTLSYS